MKAKNRFHLIVIALCALLASVVPAQTRLVAASATLELYGNFHAMGMIVTVAASDDPNSNAVATVEYRTGGAPYRSGFPLSRVNSSRFVGSLFWLTPGTAYDVRITFSDPDGHPLHGTVVQGTGATRPEIAVPAANSTLVVSPNGAGTTCNLATPCALKEAISRAQPGNEVVLRGGIYYQGDIALPRSGTAGAPIVIRRYQAEEAVLDGADPAPLSWTATGAGVYQAPSPVSATRLVVANGARLFPYPNLTALHDLTWGLPGFYIEGSTLYVHLAGNADPNGAAIGVSRYDRGFKVERSYIYFLNLTFRHYGRGNEPRGIYFNNASNNLVQDATFALNNGGITLKGAAHQNVIQGNEFYDTIFGWPWDAVKATGFLERGGIYAGSPMTGRGTVVRRNSFHDYFDGFDLCPGEPISQSSEADIYDNLIYNMGDDGIQSDGWCSNLRLWNNTIHHVLGGISFAPLVDGPAYAVRNLIYDYGVGDGTHDGRSFKFNSDDPNRSGSIYLLHNTADAINGTPYGIKLSNAPGWALVYARNNSWSSPSVALRNDNAQYPVDFDYDNLWSSNSQYLVRWADIPYATLAAFTAATGQESHGRNSNPGFVNPANGEYALAQNSALLDVGVLIPGINDNYTGAAPDLGAFEFGSVNPSPPTAHPQTLTTPEDTALAVTLGASDPDGGALTFHVVSSPSHGRLSGTPPNLVYTPDAHYFGPDSFTFKANDGGRDSNTATVGITVNAVNDVPVANSATVNTAVNTALNLTLVASDADGDGISYRMMSAPQHGTLSGNVPNLTYTPAANYTGPDSFTFVVNDGQSDSNLATVNIAVNPTSVQTPLLLSLNENLLLGGVNSRDEDILVYRAAENSWTMLFDGSDVGAGSNELDGLHLLPNGHLLVSFEKDFTLPANFTVGEVALFVDNADIVAFIPTALGDTTAGRYQMFLNGSDVGLDATDEDIDAIAFDPSGRLLVSVVGAFVVPAQYGGISGQDEDLFRFVGATGDPTSGRWELAFDASAVGLTSSSEDVGAAWSNPNGHLHLSVRGAASTTSGFSADAGDIFACAPTSLPPQATACTFSLYWDGTGPLSGRLIDGLHIGEPPALTSVITSSAVVTDTTEIYPGDDIDAPNPLDGGEEADTAPARIFLPLVSS